ncbi:MAG: BT_3928 family protein [Flavobacteriaceae bacterium]
MLKLLTSFSRLFTGILFIISGLIKLNDPVGFSFKLEEYFSEPVLNLPFLEPLALSIAVFVVIFEVVLGVMLLLGYKKKFTLWALLLMIVFFTFLTFYSAYFNKVTDCGCFGDAIKLTPWQSFGKDVILLVLIVILFKGKKYITPVFRPAVRNGTVAISLILCGFLGYWVLNHLPVIDFRAYKTGTNIQQAMSIPEDAPKGEYEITFIYNVNGQEQEFDMSELGNLPEGAEYVDRKEKLIKEGFVPKIQGFSISDNDGNEVTNEILEEEKMIWIVSYDLEIACSNGLEKLPDLQQQANQKGYTIVGLTATSSEKSEEIAEKYGLNFPFFTSDKVALKTVERANPSIVVLRKGTIVQKVHWKDMDKLKL